MLPLSRLDTDQGDEHNHTNIYAIGLRLALSGGNLPFFPNNPCISAFYALTLRLTDLVLSTIKKIGDFSAVTSW